MKPPITFSSVQELHTSIEYDYIVVTLSKHLFEMYHIEQGSECVTARHIQDTHAHGKNVAVVDGRSHSYAQRLAIFNRNE